MQMNCSSKCKVCMHVIDHFTLQYYLTKALPIKYKKQICRIRMSSHNLAIEHGRHTNTPINNRNCKRCHSDIEDEFHFILKCPHFHDIRCLYRYIKKYYLKKASVFKYMYIQNNLYGQSCIV